MSDRREGAGLRTASLVAAVLKIGVALAIVAIIGAHLSNYTDSTGTHYACLIGGEQYALCTYGFVVACVSLLASSVLAALALTTCGQCRCMNVLGEMGLTTFGFIWWVVAGAIFTHYCHSTDGLNYPRRRWRHSIAALAWSAAFVCLVMNVTYAVAVCCKARRNRRYKQHGDAGNGKAALEPPAVVVFPSGVPVLVTADAPRV